VITVRISATLKPHFSELGIDKRRLRLIVSEHLPDVFTYKDDDQGITYEVINDLVITTEYGPSAKDKKVLSCTLTPLSSRL
jgi:hypothetical protein